MKPLIIGLLVFAFLRFGLEPLAWLFYEASHALNVDSIYWGYRGFRMVDHFFSAWSYHTVACVGAGLCAGAVVWLFSRRKQNEPA